MKMFYSISSTKIAEIIKSAKERVILAAPGIHVAVAHSLVEAGKRLDEDRIKVIIDSAEDVCRLGYGHIDAITILLQNGFVVCQSPGLRVGILVCDNSSWVFSPTALYVENEPQSHETPNAIQLPPSITHHLAIRLSEVELRKTRQETMPSAEATIDMPSEIEMGGFEISKSEYQAVLKNLQIAPPVAFDIARQVRVFQPYIQYVDIELKGAALQRMRIELPASVVNLGSGAEIKDRIHTSFSLIEKNENLSSKTIEVKLRAIRDDYTRSLGKYGRFLLRNRRKDFDKEIVVLRAMLTEHQSNLKKDLTKLLDESIKELVDYYKPQVIEKPPQALKGQIQEENPNDAVAEKWLRKQLAGVFPSPDKLIKGMDLLVQYKDVTHETLRDQEFQEKIKEAFPFVDWDKPFKEYLAAGEDEKHKGTP